MKFHSKGVRSFYHQFYRCNGIPQAFVEQKMGNENM